MFLTLQQMMELLDWLDGRGLVVTDMEELKEVLQAEGFIL